VPPAERGQAYLDWPHSAMLRIATFRRWHEQPLRHAYQYGLDHDVTMH